MELPPLLEKAVIFNCNNGTDVYHEIKVKIVAAFSNIQISEKSLPVNTHTMNLELMLEVWAY